jgi:molybdopterin/thiamine biosynthesis adenylyltransferase
MYSRNRIYISPEEQEKIKHFHLLLAGAGLGSIIAECALRMGFERITIIDGDVVEISNLNRQNYTQHDIGRPKAFALAERLRGINPQAKIKAYNQYLTTENIEPFLQDVDVAINAIDFASDAPFVFDRICIEKGIPALHPYNVGWAGCVFVVNRDSLNLSHISTKYEGFELEFVDYLRKYLAHCKYNASWIKETFKQYEKEKEQLTPPQLAVASWIVGGMCSDLLFCLANNRKIKLFPDLYFNTLRE